MEVQIIQNKIFQIRGFRIMLDFHLAELYQTETRALKQAVKRNIDRFPEDFMFELTAKEANLLLDIGVSQNVIPPGYNFGVTLPMAFTEQGVAMLSSVLRSKIAIQVNIQIMRAFIAVRQIVTRYDELQRELESQINEKYTELKESIEKLKQENENQLSSISNEFENVDCQLKEIYETLTIMFSKNEHETERRPIGFIQEEDGK